MKHQKSMELKTKERSMNIEKSKELTKKVNERKYLYEENVEKEEAWLEEK